MSQEEQEEPHQLHGSLVFSVKLQIDFGGGSSCSCCCSCCDRGKTKLTPSPKTEVWTLDFGLEFDKNRFDQTVKVGFFDEQQ